MPAEFAPQEGVLLVWPVRPGSWGKDPSAAQRAFVQIMREAAKSERVYLLADAAHLEEAQAQALLQAADLLVFPYQTTQESSSGAVRFGLATLRPVACTPLHIFDDVASVVHRLPGTTAEELEHGIETLFNDVDRLNSHADRQARWLAEHEWPAASRRFWDMLRAPPIVDLVARDRDARE